MLGPHTPEQLHSYQKIADDIIPKKHLDLFFTNKIYCETSTIPFFIVDAYNTTSGKTSVINEKDEKISVIRLAQAFEESFG